MSQTALAPMKAGGQWFQWPDDRPPVYVVHEAHQKRLSLDEGATIIADPRDPHAVRVQSDEAELTRRAQQLEAQVAQAEREEQLRARIAELEATLAQRNENAVSSPINDEPTDISRATHDRRSRGR